MKTQSPKVLFGASAAALAGVAALAIVLAGFSGPAPAAEPTAIIRGSIALSAGKSLAIRVKARDPKAGTTYNVFSRQGQYRVPALPPATYEVWISQRGFDSPRQKVTVKAGETLKLDLKATVTPGFDISQQFQQRDTHTPNYAENKPLVAFDMLYPPGPGRDLLLDKCFVCHSTAFHHMKLDREGWAYVVQRMVDRKSMEGEPLRDIFYTKENFPAKDKELIVDYLAANFNLDSPDRDVKLDEFVPDEAIVSEALYIEYDVPPQKGQRPRSYHDPYVAPNGEIWANDRANHSLVRIDPQASDISKRIVEEHVAPWPDTSMHGITIDRAGRVYYADVNGGYLGELDRRTGQFKRYETTGNMEKPWNVPPGTRTAESMVQIVVDKDDNVWGNLISGEKIFRLDAKTRQIKTWLLPTPDSNPYGMIATPEGVLWTVGISSDIIFKFDPKTEKFTEYKTPTQPSAPRRLDDDADGNIWWAEYVGGNLGMLDPKTGAMKEYRFPLKYTRGYDAWVVGDYVWVTEATYETLIRFDPKTKAFVYYPLPMSQPGGNPGVPKIENEKDGTIWFAYRGLRKQPNPMVAFKPTGNAGPWTTAEAKPDRVSALDLAIGALRDLGRTALEALPQRS